MASLGQKKAMMAAVPIHPDARTILSLPAHVVNYAQLDEWKAKHGDKVSKYLGEAFRTIFDLHCKEYELTLKTSGGVGQLGKFPGTSPTHSRAGRAPSWRQTAAQDAAFNENRPPIQRQLVDAFGDPVAVDTAVLDESTFNRTSSNRPYGKSQAHMAGNEPSQRFWGPEPDSFKSKSRKASGGPSSAAAESFARQMKLNAVNKGQIPQPQSHEHTQVHDGFSKHNEHLPDVRPRHGYEQGFRGGANRDRHRTEESFARQMMVHNVARDEKGAKELFAQTERKVAGITTDKTVGISSTQKWQEDEDENIW